ncbi:hypothetical protein LTR82_013969 [Friedmanniomyces endolithicus]|uniref:Uncharacterized protein n=1 Tax=Friedmanniomyces endolithicus TaxID=329885 RepID=A0AAN6FAX7_9PEZI|nr:hypothetical protein LTR82_013969 [Friedmanniomyces endolithicus]
MGSTNFPWQHMEAARHSVLLLHEKFDITDAQRLEIFRHVFLQEARTLRPNVDVKAYSLSDAYNCRKRSDRKPWWVIHDGDHPTTVEKARRNTVRVTALARLQKAAIQLGIADPSTTDATADDGDDSEGVDEDGTFDAGTRSRRAETPTRSGPGQERTDFDDPADEMDIDEEAYERQDIQPTVNLSELGRFASWTLAYLLDGMSIVLKNPEYSDLLQFCRSHAKARKLSVVQYLERRLNQAGSNRAKATERAGQSTIIDPHSESEIQVRERAEDKHRRAPVPRDTTERSRHGASITQTDQDLSHASERLLKMVHYRDCIWQASVPRCHTGRYVDPASDVYKAGGKVFRTSINSSLEGCHDLPDVYMQLLHDWE